MISRRAWLMYAGYSSISLSQPGISWAGAPNKKIPVATAALKKHLMVSAFMCEGVKNFIFHLVHSMHSDASADEAIGAFARLVMERYPGYAVAQITVTDISQPADACAVRKESAPRKSARIFYAISAVMSQSIDDVDTMFINGWLPGRNADEALGRLLRDVTAKSDLQACQHASHGVGLSACRLSGSGSSPRYHEERAR